MSICPPAVAEELTRHFREGTTFLRKMSFWRGRLTYSLPADALGVPGKATITFTPKVDPTRYQLELRELSFDVDRIFKFYSYGSGQRFFVPGCNEETFRSQVRVALQKITEFRDKTLENYDLIVREIRDRYRGLAEWAWKHQYKNPGKPPESFVSDFCDKAISTRHRKPVVAKRFKFGLTECKPPRDDEVEQAVDSLYELIIKRRCGLTYYLLKKQKQFLKAAKRGPRVTLSKFLALWSNLVFYNDSELLNQINHIRTQCLTGSETSNQEMADMVLKLAIYLIESEDYVLGIVYDPEI